MAKYHPFDYATDNPREFSLSQRLLEVAGDFELAADAERERYEQNIRSLQSKVTNLRQTLIARDDQIEQQNTTIIELTSQLQGFQDAQESQKDSADLKLSEYAKEIKVLRKEVAALRFELSDNVMQQQQSARNRSNDGPSGGNNDEEEGAQLPAHLEPFSRVNFFTFARDGDFDAIRAILSPDVQRQPSLSSSMSNTLGVALSIAVSNGHVQLANFLISNGADTKSLEPGTDRNVLHLAAQIGNSDLLKTLLLLKTEKMDQLIDKFDRTKDTPLCIAAKLMRDDCVRVLLRHGADPTLASDNHRTPLELVNRQLRDLESSSSSSSSDDSQSSSTNPESDALPTSENDASSVNRDTAHSNNNKSSPVALKRKNRLLATKAALTDVASLFWAHSVRANRLYTQEDYVSAKRAYQAAIDIAEQSPDQLTDTNRATLHYNMARTAVQTKSHTEAIHHCTVALDLKHGNYVNALSQRAASYMSLYDYKRAMMDYEALIALNQGPKGGANWEPHLKRAKQMLRKSHDHYYVLDVKPEAPISEIKRAFRKQCLKWHPDKHRNSPDQQARSLVMFKALNEANEVLTDEQKRTLYDIERISKKMDDIVRRSGNTGNGGGHSSASAAREQRRNTTSDFGTAPNKQRQQPQYGRTKSSKDYVYAEWYDRANEASSKTAEMKERVKERGGQHRQPPNEPRNAEFSSTKRGTPPDNTTGRRSSFHAGSYGRRPTENNNTKENEFKQNQDRNRVPRSSYTRRHTSNYFPGKHDASTAEVKHEPSRSNTTNNSNAAKVRSKEQWSTPQSREPVHRQHPKYEDDFEDAPATSPPPPSARRTRRTPAKQESNDDFRDDSSYSDFAAEDFETEFRKRTYGGGKPADFAASGTEYTNRVGQMEEDNDAEFYQSGFDYFKSQNNASGIFSSGMSKEAQERVKEAYEHVFDRRGTL